MRVIVFAKATAASEAGIMPSPEAFEAMSHFNRQLMEAGILIAGEGLRPSSTGKRVQFGGTTPVVINGPFAETREVIAGFSLWRVRDLDEAMEWVLKCPPLAEGAFEVEIRPLYDMEDFADVVTPEIAEQERAFRPPLSDY